MRQRKEFYDEDDDGSCEVLGDGFGRSALVAGIGAALSLYGGADW
jgi:hypothetical protein